MSPPDALAIVARFGPAPVSIDRAGEPVLAQELALLGCIVGDHAGAGTVGVVRGTDGGESTERIVRRANLLAVLSDPGDRAAVEDRLLGHGWRRHPAAMTVADAGCWRADSLPRLSFFERSPGAAADDLLARGVTADAAIARFVEAAAVVRSGDHVLVGGLDAAAGRAVLAASSRARSIEMLDLPLGDSLAAQPLRRADVIVLTLPDVADLTEALLDGLLKAIRADGRVVIGWAGGREPLAAIENRFVVERCTGVVDAANVGWTTVVASADPLAKAPPATTFRHPAFDREGVVIPVVADFAAAYDNPWLYRAMVQLGERIGDDIALARLAERVVLTAAPASADRGAALTVLGYRVLDRRLAEAVPAIMARLGDYLVATEGGNAPHILRWRLSLLFLAGRLAEMIHDAAAAIAWFHAASLADWSGFSPILATKSIAAAFHEARLLIATGDRPGALACFRRGLDTALAAAAAPHGDVIGDRDAPLPFYLQELAEVIDMGGQCAVALANSHLLDRDPGLFWRQVDLKRFGLFAWADALERDRRAA